MKYANGSIALWRKFLDWEWYSDVNTKVVFLHLLLVANWKDGKWKGMDIKRGQRYTSQSVLAKETGLSVQKIKTAISHLESTGEITKQSTSRGMLLTIEKYNDYQIERNKSNQGSNSGNNQPANQRPTSDQPLMNKDNKENNKDRPVDPEIYQEIIDYLNKKSGKGFKSKTKETRKYINARLAEGYTTEDFKQVIDSKCTAWIGTSQEAYIRPETLFCAKHFESYLNEKSVPEKKKAPRYNELN